MMRSRVRDEFLGIYLNDQLSTYSSTNHVKVFFADYRELRLLASLDGAGAPIVLIRLSGPQHALLSLRLSFLQPGRSAAAASAACKASRRLGSLGAARL